MYHHTDVGQTLGEATPTAIGTAHSIPSIHSTPVDNILENLPGAKTHSKYCRRVGHHQIIAADVTFTIFNPSDCPQRLFNKFKTHLNSSSLSTLNTAHLSLSNPLTGTHLTSSVQRLNSRTATFFSPRKPHILSIHNTAHSRLTSIHSGPSSLCMLNTRHLSLINPSGRTHLSSRGPHTQTSTWVREISHYFHKHSGTHGGPHSNLAGDNKRRANCMVIKIRTLN